MKSIQYLIRAKRDLESLGLTEEEHLTAAKTAWDVISETDIPPSFSKQGQNVKIKFKGKKEGHSLDITVKTKTHNIDFTCIRGENQTNHKGALVKETRELLKQEALDVLGE